MSSGKKRPTPPANLVSTLPAPGRQDNGGGPKMDDEAKDNLLETLATKVNRMDEELELLGDVVHGHGVAEKGMKHDIHVLSSDLRDVKSTVNAIKTMMVQLLEDRGIEPLET